MGETWACAGDCIDRRRRHVVGRGRDVWRAGRVWRLARRGIAGVYPDHARLRSRRRRHRQNHRSLRHCHGDRAQYRLSRLSLRCGRTIEHSLAIHRGLFPDRAGVLGDFRPANGGGLALVRALPRPCRHHRGQRQLYRRHDLAAAGQLGRAVRWLANYPYRHRSVLRGNNDAVAVAVARSDRRREGAGSR